MTQSPNATMVQVWLDPDDLALLDKHRDSLRLTRAATLRTMLRQFAVDADYDHSLWGRRAVPNLYGGVKPYPYRGKR